MTEIAVFGGTFDPPTKAHEAIVEACLSLEYIDEVWWMPSGKREDKPGMLSDEARLNMLNIIKDCRFNNDHKLKVVDFEQRLPQPTKTAATVSELERRYPDSKFWFVFGADSYNSMPKWPGGVQLQKHIGVILVPRMGLSLPPESEQLRYLDIDQNGPMSSTLAREVAATEDLSSYVGPEIESYIKQQHFYGAALGC